MFIVLIILAVAGFFIYEYVRDKRAAERAAEAQVALAFVRFQLEQERAVLQRALDLEMVEEMQREYDAEVEARNKNV